MHVSLAWRLYNNPNNLWDRILISKQYNFNRINVRKMSMSKIRLCIQMEWVDVEEAIDELFTKGIE